MGFQILDANGKAMFINDLDKQAADVWGKEVHPKNYATPLKQPEGIEQLTMKQRMDFILRNKNWFDGIGLHIHLYKPATWQEYRDQVVNQMNSHKHEGDHNWSYQELVEGSELFAAEEKLIAHWEGLGYKPNAVED